jgi:hypothetical protein
MDSDRYEDDLDDHLPDSYLCPSTGTVCERACKQGCYLEGDDR